MKKKELLKLKEKSSAELGKEVVDLKKKLAQLTPRMYAGGEGNLKQRKFLRRDIAQIMTIMASQKKGEA
jgi:ribosomal protein L29